MSQTNPYAAVLTAIVINALVNKQAQAGKLPPEVLKALRDGKCSDPDCQFCNAPADAAPQSGEVNAQENSAGQPDAGEQADQDHNPVDIRGGMFIPDDIATLVGMTPSQDPESAETKARAMAAGLILGIRELAARPSYDIQKALTRNSGLTYAENMVLAAVQTINNVTK